MPHPSPLLPGLAMHPQLKVVALFSAFTLAACSENPVDAPRALNAAFGPKSVQVAVLPPLTLAEPELYLPFEVNSTVDQNTFVSNDNAPAKLGQDRPEHIKYWG